MQIVYVCADPGIPLFGTKGASVHVQEMIRAMRRAGHRVRVVCLRRGEHVPADLADLEVAVCPVDRAGGERELGLIAAAQRLPRLVLDRPADLVYERYSLFSGAVQQEASRRGVPTVLEVNAPLIDEQRRHRTLQHPAVAQECLRSAAAAASVVACVSEPVRDWVLEYAAAATLVTPNGVDTARILPRAECSDPGCCAGLRRTHAPLTVGFVGTLKPWHGVDLLIRAAATLRCAARLLVVGDGPQAAALRTLAEDLGVAADFTGAIPPAAIPARLHRMDLAVAPGHVSASQQYFSPLKMFEYAAAGLPMVIGRVGQAADLLTDGSTAELVEPGDPAALAAAIDRLAADPGRAAALGRAAREWALTRSWDAVWDAVSQRALSRHPGAA